MFSGADDFVELSKEPEKLTLVVSKEIENWEHICHVSILNRY